MGCRKGIQKIRLTPVNWKISQDKCLGGYFKCLISEESPAFVFFIPLKAWVLKRVPLKAWGLN
jgi:hypothetical protein